jgi:hypothetical protein
LPLADVHGFSSRWKRPQLASLRGFSSRWERTASCWPAWLFQRLEKTTCFWLERLFQALEKSHPQGKEPHHDGLHGFSSRWKDHSLLVLMVFPGPGKITSAKKRTTS